MAPEKYRFLLLSLVINISVGYAKPPSKIVNGTDATHIPYQVSIRDNSHFCGGSIIDKKHILTAAHCEPAVTVLVGTTDKYNLDENNIYHVVGRKQHPRYDPWNLTNDIAILILDRDIIFDEYRQPISLPEEDIPVETRVDFSGWGFAGGRNSRTLPQYLQTKSGNVISESSCSPHFLLTKINHGHICISTGGTGGPCFYDSGGPLVHGSVLVGVTAFVKSDCLEDYPSVFMRVYPSVPWIRQVLNETQIFSPEPSTDKSPTAKLQIIPNFGEP